MPRVFHGYEEQNTYRRNTTDLTLLEKELKQSLSCYNVNFSSSLSHTIRVGYSVKKRLQDTDIYKVSVVLVGE